MISVFILFHLIVIGGWAIPWDVRPLRAFKQLVSPYMVWTGFLQQWDMFAPDPPTTESWVKAVMITRNHHLRVWSFPRMEELTIAERYREERYRKFVEVLPASRNAVLWPDVVHHLARTLGDAQDPPDQIILVRFDRTIDPAVDPSVERPARPDDFYEQPILPGEIQ